MNDAALANQALTIQNTILNGVYRNLEAILGALADRAKSVEDKVVYEELAENIRNGHKNLTIPIEEGMVDTFTKKAKQAGFSFAVLPVTGNKSMYSVVFMDKDFAKMNTVLTELSKQGIQLTKDTNIDMAEFISDLGDDEYEQSEPLKGTKELGEFDIVARAKGLKYTVKMNDAGEYVVTTYKRDRAVMGEIMKSLGKDGDVKDVENSNDNYKDQEYTR